MGLMDWLFDPDRAAINAHNAYQKRIADLNAAQQRYSLNAPPTWTIDYRPGAPPKPPETHKHRMARLIARRERSGR